MTVPVPPYPTPSGLLKGKRIVVTAAAGAGIGFATAKRCAEEGARLVVSDIHERRLTGACEALAIITGEPVPGVLCDVRNEDDVQKLTATAVESMGGIDVWVNNAGLGGATAIVEMTDDEWSRVLDITLTGTFRCVRAAMRAMKDSGGVIVNNASVLGWRAQKEQAHYAAAKAGVMALTRCAGVEGADFGVRVNAVAPSLAMHPFLEKVTPPGLLDELVGKEAYGRAAKPWEVANVIVFLASDLSSYMTGEVLSVSSQRA
jgi:3-oxoacyl-[acyl-carrier protein] reductase